MTQSTAAQYLPFIQALADGKTIQFKDGYDWFDLASGHSHTWTESPEHYRIKPTLETTWRPWRPEEVPLGREVRSKKYPTIRRIITLSSVSTDWLYEEYELLQPDGSYTPCGIEEVGKV